MVSKQLLLNTPTKKIKNPFHSHPLWKTSLLHAVNPSSWRGLYLWERFLDVVMLGKTQAVRLLSDSQVFTPRLLDCLNSPQSHGAQVADDCKTATSGTEMHASQGALNAKRKKIKHSLSCGHGCQHGGDTKMGYPLSAGGVAKRGKSTGNIHKTGLSSLIRMWEFHRGYNCTISI